MTTLSKYGPAPDAHEKVFPINPAQQEIKTRNPGNLLEEMQ